MRLSCVIGRLILFAALGLLAGASYADDKPKEEKKEPKKVPLKEPYNEYVTVRRYAGQKDIEFTRPQENIHAKRSTDKKGKLRFTLSAAGEGGFVGGAPPVKSEIIDADGDTWVVTKRIGTGSDLYHLEVEKKPAK